MVRVNRCVAAQIGVEALGAVGERVERDSRWVAALNLDKKQAVLDGMTGFADASRQKTG